MNCGDTGVPSAVGVHITMEKFSTWRDKGTGISPFMPVESRVSSVKKYIVNPLILIFKLPLFFLFYSLVKVLPTLSLTILAKLIGLHEIDFLVEGFRKTNRGEIDRYRPNVGDVVVSNLVSPLDVFNIFLASKVTRLSKISVVLATKDGLIMYTPLQFVLLAFGDVAGVPIASIDEIEPSQLVILYPEGAFSNNKALLRFENVPAGTFGSQNFVYKACVVKLHPVTLTLPVPILSPFQYLYRLLTARQLHVKMRIVPLLNALEAAVKRGFADNGLGSVDLGTKERDEFYKAYAKNTKA